MTRHLIKAASRVVNIFLAAGQLKKPACAYLIPRPTFHMTTPNGYCIESAPGMGLVSDGNLVHTFVVYCPSGAIGWCSVLLTSSAIQEIDLLCAGDRGCERGRFLLAVCEEVLARFLTEINRLPPDGVLQVTHVACPLKAWVEVVLGRQQPMMQSPGRNWHDERAPARD